MLVFSQLVLEARSQRVLLKNNSKLDEFTYILKLLPRLPTSVRIISKPLPWLMMLTMSCLWPPLNLPFFLPWPSSVSLSRIYLPCYLPTVALAVLSAWNILSPYLQLAMSSWFRSDLNIFFKENFPDLSKRDTLFMFIMLACFSSWHSV